MQTDQYGRAHRSHRWGHRFESCCDHHNPRSKGLGYFFILLPILPHGIINQTIKSGFTGENMKNLYIIGGTMGVGKTAVSQQLKMDLPNSVLLDGDWCWDASPFQVTDETKSMVMDNICYLLNNFLHCSAYENVIFCWVMHQQSIIDSIIGKLDTQDCAVKCISLIADEVNLRKRLTGDVESGIRSENVIERSVARIPMYQVLNTIKLDTNEKTVAMIVNEIKQL